MDKIKAAARKSGLFIVIDSDLDFNQPTIRIDVDRCKANDLGVTMQAIGDTLALLVGENYVNRFNLSGRSYEVIPQVPRVDRLTPDTLTQYYVTSAAGQQVPLSNLVTVKTTTAPNALTQLQPAQFRDLPGGADARRHDGPGGRFPRTAGARLLPHGLQPRLPVGCAAIRPGGQPARRHLRLRADRDLPGAGGAVREPARSAGDPGQRADVDLRRADAAVPRRWRR